MFSLICYRLSSLIDNTLFICRNGSYGNLFTYIIVKVQCSRPYGDCSGQRSNARGLLTVAKHVLEPKEEVVRPDPPHFAIQPGPQVHYWEPENVDVKALG